MLPMYCLALIYLPGKKHDSKKGKAPKAVYLFLYFIFSDANCIHHHILQVPLPRTLQVIIDSQDMVIPVT